MSSMPTEGSPDNGQRKSFKRPVRTTRALCCQHPYPKRDTKLTKPLLCRGRYLPTQSQASYHSVSLSPLARRPSSAFDGVTEEANVRANAAVVPGYADVRASDAMTDDNNDDGDDGNFDDTLSEILGISSRVATSHDLDLAFGAVDVNVDLTSHLPPPLLLLLLLLGSPSEIQEFSLS